jgi:hypothetical protein
MHPGMVSCVSACIAELLGDLSKKPTRIRSISIGVLISTRVAADTKRISVSPGVRIHYPDYELGVVTWGFFPDESDWSGILTYQILGVIFLTTMALVLLAAVSYQCAATWKWIRDKTCGDPSDESAITKQQAAIRISHSLPDLQTEPLTQQYVQEHKDVVAKKVQIERNIGGVDFSVGELVKIWCYFWQVLRQTTLPIVPTRHQTFQRQLSHRLDMPSNVQFSICTLEHRSDSSIVGLIKVDNADQFSRAWRYCAHFGAVLLQPELYKKDLVRQSSADSSGGPEMEICGQLHFSLRYDKDVEGLVVKVNSFRSLNSPLFPDFVAAINWRLIFQLCAGVRRPRLAHQGLDGQQRSIHKTVPAPGQEKEVPDESPPEKSEPGV